MRRLLGLPLVVGLRRGLRNAHWARRGLTLSNPALPPSTKTLLFLCKGNICRSPFAAILANRRLAAAGLEGIEALSAGLKASQAKASPPDAIAAGTPFGIALSDHRPIDVTAALVDQSDVIVVMEPAQRDAVHERFPQAVGRVVLLSLYEADASRHAAYERFHIVDPFNKGPVAFERCYARLDRAITGLVEALAKGRATAPARRL